MMLMKETEDDKNKWNIHCFWIGRINVLKNTTTQGNLQIQCSPYQNTHDIFHRTTTNILETYRNTEDL